jgi:hypothetical protein
MAYTVNDLSGFLQIGPHYYPKRRGGVQVIMRGPHGQRLAADPVINREGRARGSGFRWWHEELNVPADVKWNPQQVVTGVMGMGALPAGWSCPYTRSQMNEEIRKIEIAVRAANTPVEIERVRAQKERLLACHMQLGQNTKYKSQRDRIINVGNMILIKKERVAPGVVNPNTGAYIPTTVDPKAVFCRRHPSDPACAEESDCSWYDIPCLGGEWLERNWWKVALGVGAVVVLYGGASGLSRGFAAKRL